MEHKFRTPVKCQNGHKAFWYWGPKQTGLFYIESIKHPDPKICDCIENHLNTGWSRDGDDQMFTGILSKFGGEIYHKDIITAFNHPMIVEFHNGSFGYCLDPEPDWNDLFASFNGHNSLTFDGNKCEKIVILGSTHLNPELIP